MSPSSTCRPGQVVSRSPLRLPLVPQLAGVPAQLPVAEMLTVCAAAGVDASAAKTMTRAASAARRRAASPPKVRERRLPLASSPARFFGGRGGHKQTSVKPILLHGPGHGNRSCSTGIFKPYSLSFRACGELRGIWTPLVAIQT